MIDITIGGIVMGLALLLLPLYIFYKYSIDWVRQTITAFVKMVLILMIMGVFLFYVMKWDSIFVDVMWVLLLSAMSTLVACHRARLSSERMFVPVMVGVSTSAIVIGAWTIVSVAGLAGLSSTRMIIPVAGLLVGTMVESLAAALSEYYGGLRYHGQLYNMLLGNGAKKNEALNFFVRRAIQKGSAQGLKQMATVMLLTAPMVMYALIMTGVDAFSAVVVEMILMVAALAAIMLALVIALYVARRYMFDDYSRLKDDIRKEIPNDEEIH